MNKINTGGPAFPVQSVYIEDQETNSHGMSLRDYFAAKAMQGVLAGDHPITHGSEPLTTVAYVAYAQADAMLKAREA
jgi:hypothetical protein